MVGLEVRTCRLLLVLGANFGFEGGKDLVVRSGDKALLEMSVVYSDFLMLAKVLWNTRLCSTRPPIGYSRTNTGYLGTEKNMNT